MGGLIHRHDILRPVQLGGDVSTGLVNLKEIDGIGKGLQESVETHVIKMREGVEQGLTADRVTGSIEPEGRPWPLHGDPRFDATSSDDSTRECF